MTKIAYFFLLIATPFIVIAFAHAAPSSEQVRPKKGVICGPIYKAGTVNFKSTPVLYLIAKSGRAFTLQPDLGYASPAKFLQRLELMDQLERVDAACLAGVLYDFIFVPDAIVDPTKQVKGRPTLQPRETARPAPAPTATAAPNRPAGQRAAWNPWSNLVTP